MANLSSYLPDGIDESNVQITGGSISGTTIAAPTITGQVILSGTNGSTTNSLDLDYNGTSGEAKIQADSGGGDAFLTFGTSDSGTVAERVRIDKTGKMLVGKTSSSLTTAGSEITSSSILQSASSTSTNLATNNGAVINLCNTSATDGNFSNIGGYNSNGLVVAQMNFINLSHSSRTGAITFTTHSGSAFNEAMRIDNTGGAIFKGSLASHQTNAGVVEYSSNLTSIHSYGATSGTGEMRFLSGGGGGSGTSEAMRIDENGFVGIGTNSPADSSSFSQSLDLNGASGAGFYARTNGGATDYTVFGNFGGEGYVLNRASGKNIRFYTENNERFRLDSDGHILFGTGTLGGDGISFLVRYSGSSTTSQIRFNRAASSVTGTAVNFMDNTVIKGSITYNNSSTAYNTTSDARVKKNIVDAPAGNIDEIRIRSFDWKVDGSHQKYGVIAQELIEVAPEAVSEGDDEDKTLAVDHSKLVPMLIKEIQDLRARVAQLEGA